MKLFFIFRNTLNIMLYAKITSLKKIEMKKPNENRLALDEFNVKKVKLFSYKAGNIFSINWIRSQDY